MQEKQSKIVTSFYKVFHSSVTMGKKRGPKQSCLKSIIGWALPQHSSSTLWTGNSVLHRCPVGTGGRTARTQHLHISAHMLLPPPTNSVQSPFPQCIWSSSAFAPRWGTILYLQSVSQTARKIKKMSWHGFSNSSLADHLLASFQQKDHI